MQKEIFDILKSRGLFGEDENYHPRNFNFFPGSNPDVTATEIADTIYNAIADIQNGGGRDIDLST